MGAFDTTEPDVVLRGSRAARRLQLMTRTHARNEG